MRKASCVRKGVFYIAAGIAAAVFAREIPAMIRYFKMARL